MSERLIGNARIYKVDKTRCETEIDEIEVQAVYFSGGSGFNVQITPQKVENHGSYKVKTFDFWNVKAYKLLRVSRYSKKSETEALKTLAEFEPYWVANMASALGLVLEHDPIHGNW